MFFKSTFSIFCLQNMKFCMFFSAYSSLSMRVGAIIITLASFFYKGASILTPNLMKNMSIQIFLKLNYIFSFHDLGLLEYHVKRCRKPDHKANKLSRTIFFDVFTIQVTRGFSYSIELHPLKPSILAIYS